MTGGGAAVVAELVRALVDELKLHVRSIARDHSRPGNDTACRRRCDSAPGLLRPQTKCQVNRSLSRETRPAEESAKWVVKTSELVSAAWFIAHRRAFRAASGNSQKTEFQSGLTNGSGWCITSPQNSACSPRELKRMQAWSIV